MTSHCRYCMYLRCFHAAPCFSRLSISESCEFSELTFDSRNESTLGSRSFTQSSMQSNSLHRPRYDSAIVSESAFGPDSQYTYQRSIETSRLDSAIASVTLTTVRLSSRDEIHPRCGW